MKVEYPDRTFTYLSQVTDKLFHMKVKWIESCNERESNSKLFAVVRTAYM